MIKAEFESQKVYNKIRIQLPSQRVLELGIPGVMPHPNSEWAELIRILNLHDRLVNELANIKNELEIRDVPELALTYNSIRETLRKAGYES